MVSTAAKDLACIRVDADDNGRLEITDGIFLLSYLFLGGGSPASPFPLPGRDATADGLGPCR